MGADVALVAAIGSALLFVYVTIAATVLCLRVLRQGGEFEMEIKAPSLALRMRASRALKDREALTTRSTVRRARSR